MTARPPIRELVILTPIYAPAVGGAAVYYTLLAHTLLDTGVAAQVTVLTERHPDRPDIEPRPDARLRVHGIRPFRAGSPARQRTRHLRYLIGEAGHAALLRRTWQPDSVLLVHASLHYHPTSLGAVLRALRRRKGRPRLVADVRDPLLPAHAFGALAPYDAVIACGRRVRDHLAADGTLAAKLAEIPVPIRIGGNPAAPPETAQRHGLVPGRDLLWPHGILRRKNLDLALAAVRELRAQGHTDARLAIAGGTRDRDKALDDALARGEARHLGAVDPAAMPALAAAAAGVIDVAEIEGMPRAMLEAIAANARVLLPPGIPEFDHHCPGHIADTRSPEALAAQLARMRTGSWPPAPYPVHAHAAERLAPAYRRVLAPQTEP